ncbi:MAG TPA: helix-turn-helix domain-containing protein [Methylocystis sp.]|jgi:hypothetical protein
MSKATISLEDRLNFGELTIAELCSLKAVGPTKVYADIREGKLPVVKRGRATRILGRHARVYIPGEGVGGEARGEPAAESGPQQKPVAA